MRSLGLLQVVVLLIAISGCQHLPRGTYALATSEVVPEPYVTVIGERVWGEYCARLIQLFKHGSNIKKFREAALNALAKAPGANALIDVKISLSGRNCARIEGIPVRLHESSEQSETPVTK